MSMFYSHNLPPMLWCLSPNIFMYLGIIAVDVPIFPVLICQLPREKACDLHDQTITFVMPPSYGFKRDFSQLQYTHRTSFFYTSSRVVTMSSDKMKVRFIHHSDVPLFYTLILSSWDQLFSNI